MPEGDMERGSTSFCHPSESASEITSSGRTCPKASYPNSLANGAGINPAATWAASLTWRSHAKHQLVSLKSSARRPALRLTNSLPSCVQKLVESETLMETKIGASIKMFDISYHRTTASVLAVGLGVLFLGLVQPARALPIDSTLFTTYESNGNTNITWVTCGSTTNTSGCYGSGTLGPFNRVCAIMEGEPVTVGNTVTRSIYVLDGGSNTISVSLNVFKKTDIITSNGDTVSITPSKKLTLPLIGGSHASCAVAANNGFIFVGTNASPNAVRVNKLTYSLTKVGAFSLPVTAITANDYGYVTVTQEAATQGSGFSVYGPNGMPQEDGGGASFIPNTTNAYLPP